MTSPHLLRWRSLLFVPGNDERKLISALRSESDAVVADWEDAVPEAEKEHARRLVQHVLDEAPPDSPAVSVRINAVGSPFFEGDIAAAAELPLDALVLPKATPAAVESLPDDLPPVIALIETAVGLRDVHAVAASGRAEALALGAVDLGLELRTEARADGQDVLFARSQLVLASACAGLRPPFDQVYLTIDDPSGLERETSLARSLGFRGKSCIHPSQLATVNRVFTPSSAEIAWAEEVVAAFDRAVAEGHGAIKVAGALVDAPVVARARRVLADSRRRSDGQ